MRKPTKAQRHGKIPEDMLVDHINGDKLDNRIFNLRLATRCQNASNSKNRKNNTSGYRGVSFRPLENKYVAYIGHEGRMISLGYFHSPKEASEAHQKAARKLHGKYRRQ